MNERSSTRLARFIARSGAAASLALAALFVLLWLGGDEMHAILPAGFAAIGCALAAFGWHTPVPRAGVESEHVERPDGREEDR